MWTAITAAVVMGGLIWMARIAGAALRERQRDEDVAELAERVRVAEVDLVNLTSSNRTRIDDAETKLAAIQSTQAMSGRPARRR